MAVCNDSVQSYFMEIRSLQSQHLIDALIVDLVRCITDLLRCTICTAKACLDDLLTIFVEELKGGQVGASGDLDQLSKPIPDLCFWESAKESKVEEGVNGCMVRSKTVFIVAIIDGNFDRH